MHEYEAFGTKSENFLSVNSAFVEVKRFAVAKDYAVAKVPFAAVKDYVAVKGPEMPSFFSLLLFAIFQQKSSKTQTKTWESLPKAF